MTHIFGGLSEYTNIFDENYACMARRRLAIEIQSQSQLAIEHGFGAHGLRFVRNWV
jgi:hypothetical protein